MAEQTLSWLDEYFGPPTPQEEGVSVQKRSVLNFIGAGVTVADDPTNKRTNITISGGTDTTLVATVQDTDTTWWRAASRVVNPSGRTTAKFVVTLENSEHSASWYTEAQLFNVTDQEVVTGSTLTNQAASDRSLATEFSVTLTVGSSAGQVKPAAKVYAVRIRAAGSPGLTNRAIISGARIDWS